MRVISGAARGKKLKTPPHFDIRPTADRVKEAVFSVIHFDLPGAKVLDLFAGCGQLGIEAISRGAVLAVMIDSAKDAAELIKENVTACGFLSNVRIAQMDALSYIESCHEEFNVIFLDPPYDTELVDLALPKIERILSSDGIVVCETETGKKLLEQYGKLKMHRKYKYGKVLVTTYKKEEGE